MSRYKTQIFARLAWYWMRLCGRYDYPAPAWYYPTDGWITDPKEIENAFRLDDAFTVEVKQRKD
jgi:hypothetical protein